MSKPQPLSDELLNRAAELRASGAKWNAVAEVLKRSTETVSAWPRRYPDRWRAALKEAESRTLCEASAESVLVLRTLLRSTDEKVARDAAKAITDLKLDLTKLELAADASAAPLTSNEARFMAFLSGHTDEQLARFAAAFVTPAAADPPVHPEPGAGDCAA